MQSKGMILMEGLPGKISIRKSVYLPYLCPDVVSQNYLRLINPNANLDLHCLAF